VVDRLSSDASSERGCIFGRHQDGREEQTLKDFLLDMKSRGINQVDQKIHPPPPTAPAAPTAAVDQSGAWGGMPGMSVRVGTLPPAAKSQKVVRGATTVQDFTRAQNAVATAQALDSINMHINNALAKGGLYVDAHHQTYFYEALQSVNVAAEMMTHVQSKMASESSPLTLLKVEQANLSLLVVSIALHVSHSSLADAIPLAQIAMQLMTNSVTPQKFEATHQEDGGDDIETVLQRYYCFVANHLLTIGLLLEPHSTMIARSFYTVGQRIGVGRLKQANDKLDQALDSSTSFLKLRFSASHSMDVSYATYLLKTQPTQVAQTPPFAANVFSVATA
jgi:hypothetical protein